MIYLELLLGFLLVGCFSFGGAYGAIPLIKEVVTAYGWVSEDMFAYFVAVSESTPGPIMVNLATYVGSSQGGILGAAIATTAVITPAFLIILLIVTILKKALHNPYVQAVLHGIEPCIIGIIFATGVTMMIENLVPDFGNFSMDVVAVMITVALLAVSTLYKKIRKKPFSPIMLIVTAAVLGIFLY